MTLIILMSDSQDHHSAHGDGVVDLPTSASSLLVCWQQVFIGQCHNIVKEQSSTGFCVWLVPTTLLLINVVIHIIAIAIVHRYFFVITDLIGNFMSITAEWKCLLHISASPHSCHQQSVYWCHSWCLSLTLSPPMQCNFIITIMVVIKTSTFHGQRCGVSIAIIHCHGL